MSSGHDMTVYSCIQRAEYSPPEEMYSDVWSWGVFFKLGRGGCLDARENTVLSQSAISREINYKRFPQSPIPQHHWSLPQPTLLPNCHRRVSTNDATVNSRNLRTGRRCNQSCRSSVHSVYTRLTVETVQAWRLRKYEKEIWSDVMSRSPFSCLFSQGGYKWDAYCFLFVHIHDTGEERGYHVTRHPDS